LYILIIYLACPECSQFLLKEINAALIFDCMLQSRYLLVLSFQSFKDLFGYFFRYLRWTSHPHSSQPPGCSSIVARPPRSRKKYLKKLSRARRKKVPSSQTGLQR